MRHTGFFLAALAALLYSILHTTDLSAHNHARTSPTASVEALIERICPGASHNFSILIDTSAAESYFELSQGQDNRITIAADCPVSAADGLHWYLKYFAGIHLSWNCMQADLPEILPPVPAPERHYTRTEYRYYLNYCTFSYSMAFWDWERWEKELDWMALHGINLCLAAVGSDALWLNVLRRLGYSESDAAEFIAGPAFQAWWLMNNLEGWGGPNPDSWYKRNIGIQNRILQRMRELGIEPVLPGYSGMLPHDAAERLGLNASDPGLWQGYHRPAFLQPEDRNFQTIAAIYYEEQEKLFGKARFYSMDPFHEGGRTAGVNLDSAGTAINSAMQHHSPGAKWVVQAWGANPRPAMIRSIPRGDLLVLDLYSESRPQWGDPASSWYRPEGFDGHDWLYCMLLNFGGNVGLHGKMQHVIDEYYKANSSRFSTTMLGVGLTMEGIENNPVMYELVSELPWRPEHFSKEEWLQGYVKARYGHITPEVMQAWELLARSIYECPAASTQQGTHESIFCARPSLNTYQVSSWSEMSDYYDPHDVTEAAGMMVKAAPDFTGCDNFEYDLIDIVRQAIAEKGRLVYKELVNAYNTSDTASLRSSSEALLQLILMQDTLLSTRPEFMVGRWLSQARSIGGTEEEKDWLEWNARVQITTWGNRTASDTGGLHDYAHKEWSGLLADFYYTRWKIWIDRLLSDPYGPDPALSIDYYSLEEPWTLLHNSYPPDACASPVPTAIRIWNTVRQF